LPPATIEDVTDRLRVRHVVLERFVDRLLDITWTEDVEQAQQPTHSTADVVATLGDRRDQPLA
jgi:Mn-dependent DtxR family transcriptional regulator